MALSECACVWDGPPSNPTLVRGCVAHLEWRNKCTKEAREAEREACAKIAADAAPMSRGSHAEGGRMTCAQIASAIRARSTLKE
jgi:hypothetical protein